MPYSTLLVAAALILFLLACRSNNEKKITAGDKKITAAEPYVEDSSSVGFDIEPLQNSDGKSAWMATYNAQGKTAKFRIELDPFQPSKDISFGKGRFVAVAGSDSSILLADLKKALEAKTVPGKTQRATDLPFEYALLGENMSQASGGGFNAQPPGHWSAIKLFLPTGNDQAEVFLNLNSSGKKGQFSMKDPDYGDDVLQYLARVL